MRNEQLGLLQIGISNVVGERIKRHESSGYEVVDIRGPQDGVLVQKWEKALKKYIASIRDLSLKIPAKGKTAQAMSLSSIGSSETWYEDELSVGSLWELMELVRDSEELVPA